MGLFKVTMIVVNISLTSLDTDNVNFNCSAREAHEQGGCSGCTRHSDTEQGRSTP